MLNEGYKHVHALRASHNRLPSGKWMSGRAEPKYSNMNVLALITSTVTQSCRGNVGAGLFTTRLTGWHLK